MAAYLSGVVQAPLTSAGLIARLASGRIMGEPIHHALSLTWRRHPAA